MLASSLPDWGGPFRTLTPVAKELLISVWIEMVAGMAVGSDQVPVLIDRQAAFIDQCILQPLLLRAAGGAG